MATVTGLTAARMAAIEASCIVNGAVTLDHLILTKHDGSTVDAGNVRGAAGTAGTPGAAGAAGARGSNFYPVGTDIANISAVAGAAIGDYFINSDSVNHTILGVSGVIPGSVVRATSATVGVLSSGSFIGPLGPRGFSMYTITVDLANVSGYVGSFVGDFFINGDTVNHTILGVSGVLPGGIVRSLTATTGTVAGNIRGPAGLGYSTAAKSHSWGLQEASGSAFADAIAGVSMAKIGGVALAVGSDIPVVPLSTYLRTDGSTGYVATPSGTPSDVAAYGIFLGVWYRNVGGVTGATKVLLMVGDFSVHGAQITIPASTASLSLDSTTGTSLIVPGMVPQNEWHRIGVWMPPSGSANTPALYRDGVRVGLKTSTTLTNAGAASRVLLGANWTSPSTIGAIIGSSDFARVITVPATTLDYADAVARSDWLGQTPMIV